MARRIRKRKRATKTFAVVLSTVFVSLTLLTGAFALYASRTLGEGAIPAILEQGSLPEEIGQASGSEVAPERASEAEAEPSSSPEDADASTEASQISSSTGEGEADASLASSSGDYEAEIESVVAPTDALEDVEKPATQITFNVPAELRAVMITAGADYLIGDDLSEATVKAQIDKALTDAKTLTMNSIIIDTRYKDTVLFDSETLPKAALELDCVEYIAQKAREIGLYVYATYDVATTADAAGMYLRAGDATGSTLDAVWNGISGFAAKYAPDAILLRDYDNPTSGKSYASYLKNGGGIGFDSYQKQIPEALVTTAATAARTGAPSTQVGLLTSGVWENAEIDPEGSATKAAYTSLGTGNVDTKNLVEDGLFNFVMAEDYGSTTDEAQKFGTVAQWWAQLAVNAQTPLYIMHASDRAGTQLTGWGAYEQLTKQMIELKDIAAVEGSAFNSLGALSADPQNSTTTLVKYMNDEINEQWVLTQLAVTAPKETEFTTKEQTVVFQGASDPQAELIVNGEKATTNESGYFKIQEVLKAGLNVFKLSHKDKEMTYNITRQVQVLKEVSPVGSVAVDGGVELTVSALAYEGASVSATLGGQNVTLVPVEDDTDEAESESGYQRYMGTFAVPGASASVAPLGTIKIVAKNEDDTQSMEGADVSINKKATMGEGATVVVVADQAETFPTNTLNDISSSSCYPLPKGTIDKTYGDEIVYSDDAGTKTYRMLESGARVYTKDIKATGEAAPDGNTISAMEVKSSDAFTTVTLKTAQKVPFKVAYDGKSVTFDFSYTTNVPQSQTIKNGKLFSAAEWSGSKLVLTFKKAGGFLGYKAYYDGDDLLLRFNNSPGSLSGARIVVDAGHGANDPGARGFYPDKNEADINLEVAKKLVAILQSRGATVMMPTLGVPMDTRLAEAREFKPQVLVSVHSNSVAGSRGTTTGSEAYYFYSFQKPLAAGISANCAQSINTNNRGALPGLFRMTRQSQFACVLAEIGYVSQEDEYAKLINSKYQTRIAQGIANAISGFLGGTDAGGGTGKGDEEIEENSSKKSSKGVAVTGVKLNESELELKEGKTFTLKAIVKPSNADVTKVKWSSKDSAVATVSSSGKVTAKSAGVTRITVTTEDGEFTAGCDVIVGDGAKKESAAPSEPDPAPDPGVVEKELPDEAGVTDDEIKKESPDGGEA